MAPNNLFFLKLGALLPTFSVQLFNADGATPFDLTGATGAKFRMRLEEAAALTVNNAAATIQTPASQGRIQYTWIGTDTAVVGRYLAEIEVDYGAGGPLVFPVNGYYHVIIQPALP